jgi:type I restriction enzyme S subunit
MSSTNFMEKLLDGVEMEWQPLEQVAKIKHGKDWKGLKEGDVPVYGSGGIMRYVDKYLYDKPTVLIPRKGSITNIFYVETTFWNVDTIYYTEIDTSKIIPKYLYHFIKTIDLMALDTGSGRPSLTQAVLNKIQIPIPCPENPQKSLEIQAEIVRILDVFNELIAELTAELNARKKQYNYYRGQLLSFEDSEVEWKTLGAVVNIKNGKDWKKLGAGNIPVYGSGGVMLYVDTFSYDKPSVLIPRKGSITNIFYVESPFWNVDTIYYTEIDTDQIIPKFFYYFMKTLDLMQLDTGSGRPSLTQAILNEIKVPLPMLVEQSRIVSILDKFDALTNSISEGLPREIELRQKQYEYYRDFLLSFPKPDSEVAA